VFRWLNTFAKAIRNPEARGPILVAGLLIAFGTIFYQIVEKWSFVDSVYFSVTTLTTVGFGNPAPTTDLGKLFTTFYVIAGVGMFLAVVNAVGKAAIESERPHLRKSSDDSSGDQGADGADGSGTGD
jgi:hypothetical protein